MTRQIPATILAGDSLKITINTSDYSEADGWSVVLKCSGPSGGPVPYSFDAVSVSGTQFEIALTPAETSGFGKGLYNYALVVSDATDEYTIESGTFQVELRADLNFDSDFRSHARKVLDAIEAVIEGRASKDQESYTIAGRTLNRTPLRELLSLRKYYQDVVAKEDGTTKKKLLIRLK